MHHRHLHRWPWTSACMHFAPYFIPFVSIIWQHTGPCCSFTVNIGAQKMAPGFSCSSCRHTLYISISIIASLLETAWLWIQQSTAEQLLNPNIVPLNLASVKRRGIDITFCKQLEIAKIRKVVCKPYATMNVLALLLPERECIFRW